MSAAQPIEEGVAAMDDRADRLAAVRRVDWRFLLPDPSLGRVAYLAPHDPAVVSALTEVTGVVDVLGSVDEARGSYDVAVVTGGRADLATTATALLRSGGWVTAEVRGTEAGRRARALRERGFQSVEAFWLWPDSSACREMVPLTAGALHEAIGRRDPGGHLRVRVRLAEALAKTPLMALAMRSVVVIGSAP